MSNEIAIAQEYHTGKKILGITAFELTEEDFDQLMYNLGENVNDITWIEFIFW